MANKTFAVRTRTNRNNAWSSAVRVSAATKATAVSQLHPGAVKSDRDLFVHKAPGCYTLFIQVKQEDATVPA